MATSGTFIFNPDLAEIVDEAFERCRVDPAKITSRHILSARRSMRFMLADWATKDYNDFRIQQYSFAVTQGTASYTDPDIPASILDVLDAVLRRNGVDTPIIPYSRADFINIPEKTIEGRPDRWFIEKGRDGITATFWPVPENSTDEIVFNAVRKFEDADTASDNADIPYHMYEAFASGLAAKLAEKFAPPEMEQGLVLKAAGAFRDGMNAVRERGDVRIVPTSSYRRRRGTRGTYR